MLLVEALKEGYIPPAEFENFNFLFWRKVKRQENTEPETPYFKATTTYTDKKRSDGIYPYANFIPDTFALTQYYNEIVSNGVYVIDRGRMLEEINMPAFNAAGMDLESHFLSITQRVASISYSKR